MTGTATVAKASYNFSGSRLSPVMGHINASVEHIQRPLMTPDEVGRIKPPRKEGEGNAERIVEPGDMLIFVSGHHPILGTQMLYFADPVLMSRAQLPPPDQFWSIEKGVVARQPPIDRTRREISEAETFAPHADGILVGPVAVEELPNPRMQSFIEEFTTGANTSSCK
jgi:type IV secretion system protein VirD4